MSDFCLAPIVLFVYNRPWHTEKTLMALKNNVLAPESNLYIYSDGEKHDSTEEERKKINEVRKIIRTEKWCKNVTITEFRQNQGLSASIINGVTKVLNQYDKIIVLEDDLVTSKYFLNYMNGSLDHYAERKSVFSVSGFCPPPGKLNIPPDYSYDVFVSLRNSSWGWGTWKDRWEKVDWSMSYFDLLSADRQLVNAFNRGGKDLFPYLVNQYKHNIDSWAIRFAFTQFSEHAVTICPCISYVNNIGMDGSGKHSSIYTGYENDLLNSVSNPIFLDILYEDKRIINNLFSSFSLKKRSLIKRLINRISRQITDKNIFVLKEKVYH